jgi:hypothetical protein
VIGATGAPYKVSLSSDIALDSLTINSPDATLAKGSGSVHVIGAVTVSSGTLLVSSIGTLACDDNINLQSRMTWTGGRLKGPGTFNIASGAIVNADSSTSTVRRVMLQFNNGGTFNLNGGTVGINTGTFSNLSGATLNLSAGGTLDLQVNGFFRNSGTINVNASAGSALISASSINALSPSFDNSGTIAVQSGSLSLKGGALNYETDSTFIGPGRISFAPFSGHVINGTSTFAGSNITIDGATFSGAGNIDVTGTVAFNSGTLGGTGALTVVDGGVINIPQAQASSDRALLRDLSNSGTINLLPGATLLLSSATNQTGEQVVNGHLTLAVAQVHFGNGTISGSGSISQTGTMTWETGTISMSGGLNIGGVLNVGSAARLLTTLSNSGEVNVASGNAMFLNAGTVVNQAAGVINCAVGTPFSNQFGAPAGQVQNSGLVNVHPSAGSTSFAVPIANTGTVVCDSGSLVFSVGTFTNSGTLVVASRALVIGPSSITVGASIVNTGTVDLRGAMAFDYSGASPFANLKSQIVSGYAGGAWNGIGINSAPAALVAEDSANLHKTGIGYGEASAVGLVGVGTFAGIHVDDSSVLLCYTLLGDVNLDGQVTSGDFASLATHFNQADRNWSDGDANYDGVVNSIDFNLLASNFGLTLASPTLGTLVPEPLVLGLTVAALCAMRRRRVTFSRR